jgi:hypothetical protein
VSFKISPYPSRLQEFLVHMDVVNKTNSESIQVNQLSTIGSHWEISLLQPIDTIFPSQSLIAGQAFSCFFVLKVGTRICIFRAFLKLPFPCLLTFYLILSLRLNVSFFLSSISLFCCLVRSLTCLLLTCTWIIFPIMFCQCPVNSFSWPFKFHLIMLRILS